MIVSQVGTTNPTCDMFGPRERARLADLLVCGLWRGKLRSNPRPVAWPGVPALAYCEDASAATAVQIVHSSDGGCGISSTSGRRPARGLEGRGTSAACLGAGGAQPGPGAHRARQAGPRWRQTADHVFADGGPVGRPVACPQRARARPDGRRRRGVSAISSWPGPSSRPASSIAPACWKRWGSARRPTGPCCGACRRYGTRFGETAPLSAHVDYPANLQFAMWSRTPAPSPVPA